MNTSDWYKRFPEITNETVTVFMDEHLLPTLRETALKDGDAIDYIAHIAAASLLMCAASAAKAASIARMLGIELEEPDTINLLLGAFHLGIKAEREGWYLQYVEEGKE